MKGLSIKNLVYQHYRPLHVLFNDGTTDVITSIDYDVPVIGFLNRNANSLLLNNDFKLILRPLSDLSKEEWKRKLMSLLSGGRSDSHPDSEIKIVTKPKFSTFKIEMYTYRGLNFSELLSFTVYKDADESMTKHFLMEWYFENQFDVFGLIEKGLAVEFPNF